jgi:hypothetical protein
LFSENDLPIVISQRNQRAIIIEIEKFFTIPFDALALMRIEKLLFLTKTKFRWKIYRALTKISGLTPMRTRKIEVCQAADSWAQIPVQNTNEHMNTPALVFR